MSVKVMARVWEHAAAEGGRLLILLALADFANEDGVSWPSVNTLAQKARVTRRHAQRLITELHEQRLIEITLNGGPHGSNLYQIAGGDILSSPRHLRQGGVTSGAKGATSATKRGDAHVTLTVIEPSSKPSWKRHAGKHPKRNKSEEAERLASRYEQGKAP